MADNDNQIDDDFQQNDPDDVNPMYQIKKDEKLEGDNNTPFSPPSGVKDNIDVTFPVTDSNLDQDQHYNEGIESTADVDLPDEPV